MVNIIVCSVCSSVFISFVVLPASLQIRNHLVELTSVAIYDVRLIKDKVTGISRGFCFIELGSVEVCY